ncbi:uncharacterized protein BJ171DRAFT_596728 [Polychytrium aggregatum]|uniref:uncharacterized protein n=1 Tax=Polychytrium aggregatum TaxID=110093 RepID=UPI0022FEABE2|nr:uncharacterized protein BJ171DRAFT_596728 [Polychytrium aggregatum]KAI9207136.1 hypothetical protein BJ171DRAFT_596728 [Polychytrium aggregatum]
MDELHHSPSNRRQSIFSVTQRRGIIRSATITQLLDAKNIGMFAGLVFLFNNTTGPAIPLMQAYFQQNGWVPLVVVISLYAIVSTLCSLFIVEAMQCIPGNKHFQGTVEFSTLINFYLGGWAHLIGELFLFLSLQATAICSIIQSAQTFDYLVLGFHNITCGVSFSSPYWLCVGQPPNGSSPPSSPFGDAYMLMTPGYLIMLIFVAPLGMLKFADSVTLQIVAFVLTMAVMVSWIGISVYQIVTTPGANLPIVQATSPESSITLSTMMGGVMMNFAFIITVPSWVNAKKMTVNIQTTLWSSTILSATVYILVGWIPALAFAIPANGASFLSVLENSGSILNSIVAYAFIIMVLVSSIPIFFYISRENLVQNGICSPKRASYFTHVAPWIVAIPMLTGSWMLNLTTWSSLLFVSVANFIIPLVIYMKAVSFRRLYNETRELTRDQKELLKKIHSCSSTIRNFIDDSNDSTYARDHVLGSDADRGSKIDLPMRLQDRRASLDPALAQYGKQYQPEGDGASKILKIYRPGSIGSQSSKRIGGYPIRQPSPFQPPLPLPQPSPSFQQLPSSAVATQSQPQLQLAPHLQSRAASRSRSKLGREVSASELTRGTPRSDESTKDQSFSTSPRSRNETKLDSNGLLSVNSGLMAWNPEQSSIDGSQRRPSISWQSPDTLDRPSDREPGDDVATTAICRPNSPAPLPSDSQKSPDGATDQTSSVLEESSIRPEVFLEVPETIDERPAALEINPVPTSIPKLFIDGVHKNLDTSKDNSIMGEPNPARPASFTSELASALRRIPYSRSCSALGGSSDNIIKPSWSTPFQLLSRDGYQPLQNSDSLPNEGGILAEASHTSLDIRESSLTGLEGVRTSFQEGLQRDQLAAQNTTSQVFIIPNSVDAGTAAAANAYEVDPIHEYYLLEDVPDPEEPLFNVRRRFSIMAHSSVIDDVDMRSMAGRGNMGISRRTTHQQEYPLAENTPEHPDTSLLAPMMEARALERYRTGGPSPPQMVPVTDLVINSLGGGTAGMNRKGSKYFDARRPSLPINPNFISPVFRSLPTWFPIKPKTVAIVCIVFLSVSVVGSIVLQIMQLSLPSS